MNIKQFAISSLSGLSVGFFASAKSTDSNADILYEQAIIAIGLFFAAMSSLRRGEHGTYELAFAFGLIAGRTASNVTQKNNILRS